MKRKENGNRRKAWPVWKKALVIVGSVVLAVVLLTVILVWSMLSKIRKPDPDRQIVAPEEEYFEVDEPETETQEVYIPLEPEDVQLDTMDRLEDSQTALKELAGDDELIQIMLIGQDTRDGTRARSDTMILLTIDPETGKMDITSFMRDLYVAIPGYSDNRLNAAYAFGGMELLDETIYTNFGVAIDGNVEVNFEGFEELVDMMGGVSLYLSAAEADHLVNYCGVTQPVKEGVNVLTGKTARTFAQTRSLGNSDYDRTARQRRLLLAIFEQVKTQNLYTVTALINKGFSMLTTDLSQTEILQYAAELLPILKSSTIDTHRIPVDGAYTPATIRGMMVLVPDLEANRRHLETYFADNGEATP